uniref:Uncharacterized protein n=1 Tax=Zea mays TaxID=4577 RepID=A0A804UGW6_MAIZE
MQPASSRFSFRSRRYLSSSRLQQTSLRKSRIFSEARSRTSLKMEKCWAKCCDSRIDKPPVDEGFETSIGLTNRGVPIIPVDQTFDNPPCYQRRPPDAASWREDGQDLHVIPHPPLADLPRPVLEHPQLAGGVVLREHLPHKPWRPQEVAQEAAPAEVHVGVAAVHVLVDAVVAVVGEDTDLVHPRAHLHAVLAAGVRRAGQVHQEAVHALHLLLDELHVATDAAQQPRLVPDHAQQRAHGARRELSHRRPALSPPPGSPAAAGLACGFLLFSVRLHYKWNFLHACQHVLLGNLAFWQG